MICFAKVVEIAYHNMNRVRIEWLNIEGCQTQIVNGQFDLKGAVDGDALYEIANLKNILMMIFVIDPME